MKKENIIFWSLSLLGIIALTLGIFKLANYNQNTKSKSQISIDENTKGNQYAELTLVEYSDFQCPACQAYYALTKQLMNEMGDEIKLIYRNFPLSNIHPQAELAAKVAEAAALQNKFWEMHNLLFENQQEWSQNKKALDIFISYAQKLNLDSKKFINDLENPQVQKKIQRDINNGNLDKINGTPSFFVNGQKINNPRSYNQFKNEILQFKSK